MEAHLRPIEQIIENSSSYTDNDIATLEPSIAYLK
jgi:hypothetical protein